MVAFRYRSFVEIGELTVGECTVHRAGDGTSRWWNLWLHVRRNDGVEDTFVVAVAPRGAYQDIPGRRTWGLTEIGGGQWQAAPSINVTASEKVRPGAAGPGEVSLWHENVIVEVVTDGEPWTQGGIP